jgi:glycogen debranching enzyme
MHDIFTRDGNLFYVPEPHVQKNVFLTEGASCEGSPLPEYDRVKDLLPEPFWEGHGDAVAAYDKAWRTAFKNLRKANRKAGFVSDFIDTAFNGFLFMWDSSFIVMFGKYGVLAFDFQKTLDNFYSHQHRDGFICREISETDGMEQFSRDDPASTGPNVLPWAEWEYYQTTGNGSRLGKVFDPLMAYHNWLRLHRSWQDGTYWSCGLACGMDNQPRAEAGYDPGSSHGFLSWIDACAQQYLSARILTQMGELLGRQEETGELKREAEFLKDVINRTMWSDVDGFYFDRRRDGTLTGVKSAGAYWTLLAGIVPEERRARFIGHLDDPAEFKRHNRVPTLSADDPHYCPDGGYWLGSVWAPTNYMILKGLDGLGTERAGKLAHEIAKDYLGCVVRTFNETGTLFENYAPERDGPGIPAKDEFVGWTGLAPISVFFEYVFGIRPYALDGKIVWDLRLTESHGIRRYPFKGGTLDLFAGARKSADEFPEIKIESTVEADVEIRAGGKTVVVHAGGKK